MGDFSAEKKCVNKTVSHTIGRALSTRLGSSRRDTCAHMTRQEYGHTMICDGCNVREPWEHRCHGKPCPCEECREADRLFGSR